MPLFTPNKLGFRDRPLLFIDLELTGLDTKKHEIIEVAALLVRQPDFEVVESYYTKVVPTHIETADPVSLKISGYDASSWKEAISLREMLIDLSKLAPDCIIAGWGVHSEWDFLIAALESENLPYFFTSALEVQTLAFRHLYGDHSIDRLGLSKVSAHLGIHLDNHRPDSDIRATYKLFRIFMSQDSSPTENPA